MGPWAYGAHGPMGPKIPIKLSLQILSHFLIISPLLPSIQPPPGPRSQSEISRSGPKSSKFSIPYQKVPKVPPPSSFVRLTINDPVVSDSGNSRNMQNIESSQSFVLVKYCNLDSWDVSGWIRSKNLCKTPFSKRPQLIKNTYIYIYICFCRWFLCCCRTKTRISVTGRVLISAIRD